MTADMGVKDWSAKGDVVKRREPDDAHGYKGDVVKRREPDDAHGYRLYEVEYVVHSQYLDGSDRDDVYCCYPLSYYDGMRIGGRVWIRKGDLELTGLGCGNGRTEGGAK